jgi:hypothetical protein
MAGGITLVEWYDGALLPEVRFPPDMWKRGFIIIGNNPCRVNKWVRLYRNGRLQWKVKIGESLRKGQDIESP